MSYLVATFYRFVDLPDYREKQPEILDFCQKKAIKGTILLAREGINATIAGTPEAIAEVLAFLRSDRRLADLEHKESRCERIPFGRLKVRLKKEIVTLGQPSANPNEKAGTRVPPREWNQLIRDPDTIVIDTRNQYEVAIGTFAGAIEPRTRHFREFPEFIEQHRDEFRCKKIAMFCTGGIRCEKASSFLLDQGFEEVYQLHGGILRYLAEVPPEESLWRGECFVFDERVAIDHHLQVGHYQMCPACGHPIDERDKASPKYREGRSCPHCYQESEG
ncbi:rhodanese-related sulfurtransferase [Pannus brasiliensis CCIBt3594]|uniref:tRNA uridine(34) hydroxylase n=1 Tax=Pannus brasiliensis CCIBt3594 TaxID=1427578 RepID=A0AAW9QRH9_9CHRO